MSRLLNEGKENFSKETSRKILSAVKSINPLDEDTNWLFQEIFEDRGFKRLDKNHDLEKALYELNMVQRSFKKKAIEIWKVYNRYAQKGL